MVFSISMFVRVKKKDDQRFQIQVVENTRNKISGKVKQKIVRNIGVAHNTKEIEAFRKVGENAIVAINAQRQPTLSFVDPTEYYASKLEKSRRKTTDDYVYYKDIRGEKILNEGYFDFFAPILEDAGLDKIVCGSKSDRQWNNIINTLVISRIKEPLSKLATLDQIADDFDINIPYQKVYRSLDYLIRNEDKVKANIANYTLNLFDKIVDVLFFDVTTLYFESIENDELKDFGFSKDCKFKEVQILLALIATKDGLPISYEIFPGNTFEGHTLEKTVSQLSNKFCIDKFIFVADRGMFSENNLKFMEKNGYKYIVAAKLKKQGKDLKNKILTDEFSPAVANNEFHWRKEYSVNARRLIVSFSSKRAKKDALDRKRLIDRLLKKARNNKIKLTDLIPNYGNKKYVTITSGKAEINHAKIELESQWDGLHGVMTNDLETNADEILANYRGLWQIEEVFRVNKNFLRMRPIFHWKPKRIKAHILLCFISYSLLKFALFKIKAAGVSISEKELRKRLNRITSTIVTDKLTKKKYVIPTKNTKEQQEIYAVFGLARSITPYAI